MDTEKRKIYFASDFHLGIPGWESSLQRELLLIQWLEMAEKDAEAIYLMGDLFDFWFEYKTVIPKGFARLLGKLASICDSGIPVHLFKGNHDLWAFDYLQTEIGIQLHRESEIHSLHGKKFYLAHGDGLGPGDNGYKFLKKVFENRLNQWLFRWLHPDFGTRLALDLSRKSRISKLIIEGKPENQILPENESIVKYARQIVKENPSIDFLVFGHRHVPIDLELDENTRCIIIGDWVKNFSYVVFDGSDIQLKRFINK